VGGDPFDCAEDRLYAEDAADWVRRVEMDSGRRDGLTSDEQARIKELQRGFVSSGGLAGFSARRQRFSPRQSSTADRSDGGIRRSTPRSLRGRVDPRDVADRPVDLLRTERSSGRGFTSAEVRTAGRCAVQEARPRLGREP